MEALSIKVNERDNVAVAIRDLPKGTELPDGTVLQQDIPRVLQMYQNVRKIRQFKHYRGCIRH